MTTITRPHVAIDQVSDVLRNHLGLDATAIARLKPGAWSCAFGFDLDEAGFVIRFSHVREDFDRDAYASKFSTPLIPVPRVTHRGAFGELHYAVSERVTGHFIDQLTGTQYQRALPALLETLDALRRADTTSTEGHGTWDADGNGIYETWPDFFRSTVVDHPGDRGGGWRPKLETSATGATSFDRDLKVLERLLPDLPNFRNVIHSDLLNFNCFVRNRRVSGIIDWGCALYGDFAYEIAWFSFWAPWFPQWSNVDFVTEAARFYEREGADMAEFRERLTCYELHIGLTHQAYNASINNWEELARAARRTSTIADRVR